MESYSLRFDEGWDKHFKKFDASIQEHLMKKINQLRQPLNHRHMKQGLPYFVEEVGGYRSKQILQAASSVSFFRFNFKAEGICQQSRQMFSHVKI
ncbi:TPA: hypothetical protein HA244_01550 [Candidatus Micrarchaeota archaeon]|nr:hypothetical protein [Candidatus Micrarchaeota archaeon]